MKHVDKENYDTFLRVKIVSENNTVLIHNQLIKLVNQTQNRKHRTEHSICNELFHQYFFCIP